MKKLICILFALIVIIAFSSCNNEKHITGENEEQFSMKAGAITFKGNKDTATINYDELKKEYIRAYNKKEFLPLGSDLSEKYTNLGYYSSNNISMYKITKLNTIQTCYYPIELYGELVFLDYLGNICVGTYGISIIDAHIPNDIDNYKQIYSSPTEKIIIHNNMLNVYSFGEITYSYQIPDELMQDLNYCGYSYFNGFIFKSGNNVYSININSGNVVCKLIATGVAHVIDASYNVSVDAEYATLLHMEDGNIMAYLDFNEELFPVYNDGEYSDTIIPYVPHEYRP